MPKFFSDTHLSGTSTDLAIDGNITGTGNLTLEHADTPTIVLKDTTNDLRARFRVANSYAYLSVDGSNSVNGSRLVFQVDGSSALYLTPSLANFYGNINALAFYDSDNTNYYLNPAGSSNLGGNLTIDTTGTTDNLLLTSTDTSSASAPDMVLYRNAAIADSDTLGVVEYKGKNGMVPSSSAPLTYNAIYSRIADASNNQSILTFSAHKGNGSGSFIHAVNISAIGTNNSATGAMLINPASDFDLPTYNLHVKGTAKITSTLSVDGSITASNLSGTNTGDQDLSGYLTSLPSHNHDDRYYTETESDAKYLLNTTDTLSGALTVTGDLTVHGTTFGLYHGTVEDDYYFDSYNGSKHLSTFVKNARADIIRYQSIDNLEYWNGSSWQDMTSQLANVKKLLDGRQDTYWMVPSTYYKFRFTVSPSTTWPLQAKIGQQLSWSGSQYPGSKILVEEDANDGNGFQTLVTADFGGSVGGSQTPLNSNNNGITGWGLMFKADSALHTGKGSSQRTRITVDYYGWSPSNSSHVTIPLQNLFITSNYAGTENTDYTNLLDYDRNISIAGNGTFAGNGGFLGSLEVGDASFIVSSTGAIHTDSTLNVDGNATFGGSLYMPDYIYHSGDTNTYFGFNGADQWKLHLGGGDRLVVTTSQFTSNLNVAAPLYYDKDNTSYYLDPASTSTSLNVAGGGTFQSNVTIDTNGGTDNYYLTFSESGSNRFTIYENSNNVYFNGWAGHTIFRPQMGGSGSFAVYGGNTQFDTSGNATFAGNIVVSGTVDGRDIATDGTKLDTIATNADVTPSWVPSSDPSYFKQGSYSVQYTGDMDSLTGFRIIRSTSGSNRAFAAHHNAITIPNSSSSQYGAQLAFETGTVSDGGIKFRSSTNGTFTSWYRLYHEGHLPTLAELGAQASGSYITGTGSLSAQDLTDIGNLSGTNSGDQDLSGLITQSDADTRYVNVTGDTMTGDLTADQFISTNNGNGQNYRIGDDAWIGDINVANTFRISGNQNGANGYITFGNSSNTQLGRAGTGDLTWGGVLRISTSVKSPIFYDKDNTSYFIDPAGSSSARAATLRGRVLVYDEQSQGGNISLRSLYRRNYGGQHHEIGQTVLTAEHRSDYVVGNGRAVTALVLGNTPFGTAAASSGKDIFNITRVNQAAYGPSTGLGSFGKVLNLRGNGDLYLGVHTNSGAVYATKYYDKASTSYYLDPGASVSLNVAGTGSFGGNVSHQGLTMTTGTDVDQVKEFSQTFQLTANTWTDTTVVGSQLNSGTYAMQVHVDDYSVGGNHYDEIYSAMISWYSSSTNSTHIDEIVTHRAGHAPNNGDIQFRTQRASATDSHDLMLQVKHNLSYSAALNGSTGKRIIFKFRRLI